MGVLRDFFHKRIMIKEVCMNHRSLKVFIACFLGGCIGSVVALEVSKYLWWVGLLVGAAVGYLSYEFKEVVRAIPLAWHRVMHWHPDRKFWKNFGYFFFRICSVYATFLFGFFILMYSIVAMSHADKKEMVYLFVNMFVLTSLTLSAATALAIGWSTRLEEEVQRNRRELKTLLYKANPIIVYLYYVPKYTAIGIWFVVCCIPYFFVSIGRGFAKLGLFVWTVFKLIHSDIRLLCAVDAAIGVCVGFFLGSAIFGGLAGGLWGVLNFEILSKRVLKLVPLKVRIS